MGFFKCIWSLTSLATSLSGFLIYFGYGMWHSEERQRQRQGPLNNTGTKENIKTSREKQDGMASAGKDQEHFTCPEKTSQC